MKITPPKIIIITLCLLFTLAAAAGIYIKTIIDKVASDDPTVWEDDIRDFEAKDRKTPPELNRILFVGSSSIRKWKTLQEDMAPLKVINRGFGGSKIPDIIYYVNRIVLPYKPKTIVFYAGDNDMSRGKRHSPEQVLDNCRTFTNLIHAELPETKIFFISIIPSKLRWKYWKNMNRANELIKEYTRLDNRLISVGTCFLRQIICQDFDMLSRYNNRHKMLFCREKVLRTFKDLPKTQDKNLMPGSETWNLREN